MANASAAARIGPSWQRRFAEWRGKTALFGFATLNRGACWGSPGRGPDGLHCARTHTPPLPHQAPRLRSGNGNRPPGSQPLGDCRQGAFPKFVLFFGAGTRSPPSWCGLVHGRAPGLARPRSGKRRFRQVSWKLRPPFPFDRALREAFSDFGIPEPRAALAGG